MGRDTTDALAPSTLSADATEVLTPKPASGVSAPMASTAAPPAKPSPTWPWRIPLSLCEA